MKNSKNYLYSIIVTGLLITLVSCSSSGQSTSTAGNAVAHAVDSSNWKFTATDAIPQYGGGGSRRLDANQDVKYSNNKLVVYLPYFGRDYTGASAYANKGPLDFTSNDVTIKKQKSTKGRWLITIIPNDNREVQSMNFTIYPNGNTNLAVTMTNRSGISYSGTVEPIK
ncbi:DUF4251 domain-containing protein [Ferruginibacter sp. SUN106]|uniref:DUF4251 domain-containing protein n=1 Tax=Ferruginibacter sp. SUN106 TaxID=2978348 RepID=UPI003D35B6E0